MLELKLLSKDGVPAALEKAMRYRLLNEPMEAESICLDVLAVDPENQEALVTLLLSLTDQFDHHLGERVRQASAVLPRLRREYDRVYYEGIICERQAKAHFRRGNPGSPSIAYRGFRLAMARFEQAAAMSPPGNDDALLRWNACVRILAHYPELRPAPEETSVQFLE